MKSSIWGGVFDFQSSSIMKEINASIGFDKELYKYDILGSKAHSKMLVMAGVLTKNECDLICKGLDDIQNDIESGVFEFSEDLEDIHMNIEFTLGKKIGDAAKKLHSARSRNDQVAVDFKMYVRDAFLELKDLLTILLKAIVKKADENFGRVMPSFTHLQIAQPILLSHWLLAYAEMFWRDLQTVLSLLDLANECPLGAGALAGTTYNINRDFTASELGFDFPTKNSIDSVSDRDFALDFLFASSKISLHLSRLAEEIVIFGSQDYSYIKLSDAFSTGSSMMPQKKNPDAAELVRGKTGSVFSALFSLFTILKGLPLAYSKDMQEDKPPVFRVKKDISLVLRAMIGMIEDVSFDYQKLESSVLKGFCNATDLADYLVQVLKLPFRDAHHVSGCIVRFAIEKNKNLTDLSLDDMQSFEKGIQNDIFEFIKIESCINRRTSYGGTASKCVYEQIKLLKKNLGMFD